MREKNSSIYKEKVFCIHTDGQLNEENNRALKHALEQNQAVGTAMGYYEEGLPMSFASHFFLENLGYQYDEFLERTGGSLLELVDPQDRVLFEKEYFRKNEGRRKFKMLTRDGAPVYVCGFKTESKDENGTPMWVLSVRLDEMPYNHVVSQELYSYIEEYRDENERLEEEKKTVMKLINGLIQLIHRFAICDLKRDEYVFYGLQNGMVYEPKGKYKNLVMLVSENYKMFSDMDTIEHAFSKEYIRSMIHTERDVYRFDYMDKSEKVYKNASIIPLEWEDGILTKVLLIAQDITEEKQREIKSQKALKDAYEAANRANVAKTQFLSNMSHDIRTPMNAIIGMTAIAGAHLTEENRMRDCLGKITSSSRHLLSLINEVLDMSRIESGKLTLNEEEFNLAELTENLVTMVKPDIAKNGHEFDIRILNIEHEDVYGDSLRIQQMFTNIMSNAIKYTPYGGKIRFTLSEKPTHHKKIGCYEIVIEDNGIGMSEEFQKVIFEPFSRADYMRTTEIQGTGLGMAITKNIVNMMSGDIKVESTLGKGSRFTVTVFLKLQEQKKISTEEFIDLPVLVVDDDEACCENTVSILNEIGMSGESVTSGKEAIKSVVERHEREEDYFAVIMDWKMPEMDGIETTRQIRKRVGRNVPIIVLSAYDCSEIEEEAREAGVDEFIAKPLFKSRLTTVLKQIVEDDKPRKERKGQLDVISNIDYSDKRVLIVEDNELNREIAVEIVGTTGAEIEVAGNGKEAVDLVEEKSPGYYDLILMDIQMPLMNGYEAAAAIRSMENKKKKDLPIIAMTANAFAEDVVMAKNAGMNEHIAKPLDLQKLALAMKEWI